MGLRCYYAHCIAIYNTPQEKRDVETLEKLGFEVANPNTPECAEGYKKEGMPYFQKFADECDFIAFRGIPSGGIPAGVGGEIKMFTDKGKSVIELPSGLVNRVMSVDATREYLKEVGQR